MFHRKERDASAVARAKRMHDECMKDPEYAEKWSALTYALAELVDAFWKRGMSLGLNSAGP